MDAKNDTATSVDENGNGTGMNISVYNVFKRKDVDVCCWVLGL